MKADNERKAAYAADERFSAELVRQFGADAAGDARYTRKADFDTGTRAAYKEKLRADDAFIRAAFGI